MEIYTKLMVWMWTLNFIYCSMIHRETIIYDQRDVFNGTASALFLWCPGPDASHLKSGTFGIVANCILREVLGKNKFPKKSSAGLER